MPGGVATFFALLVVAVGGGVIGVEYASMFGALGTKVTVVDQRDRVLKWIKEYSPLEHVSKDDPPVFLEYGGKNPPVIGEKTESYGRPVNYPKSV